MLEGFPSWAQSGGERENLNLQAAQWSAFKFSPSSPVCPLGYTLFKVTHTLHTLNLFEQSGICTKAHMPLNKHLHLVINTQPFVYMSMNINVWTCICGKLIYTHKYYRTEYILIFKSSHLRVPGSLGSKELQTASRCHQQTGQWLLCCNSRRLHNLQHWGSNVWLKVCENEMVSLAWYLHIPTRRCFSVVVF